MASDRVEPWRTAVARAAASAAGRFGDRVALRDRQDGGWRERTFAESGELVDEFALGLEPGERVCILANDRSEWTLASVAISRAGGVVVPIYPTDLPQKCEWVASDSEARMTVCENALQADKIAQVRRRPERLEHVIAAPDVVTSTSERPPAHPRMTPPSASSAMRTNRGGTRRCGHLPVSRRRRVAA
jgi:long-chain acyl-CoA synthetase